MSLGVFANGGGTKSSATDNFAAVTSVGASKDIILQGGTGGASMQSVTNAFPNGGGGPGGGPVPEPGTSVLLSSGLLVSALWLRRRRSA